MAATCLLITRARKDAAVARVRRQRGTVQAASASGAGLLVLLPNQPGVRATFSTPSTWLRLPVVWLAVCGCNIGMYVLAVSLVETVVAVVAFEMWPVYMMLALARRNRIDGVQQADDRRWQRLVLVMAASAGLSLVFVSQTTGMTLSGVFTVRGVPGVLLAFGSGAMGAANVYLSIVFSRTALAATTGATGKTTPSTETTGDEVFLLAWYSVLAVTIGWSAAVVINALLGAVTVGLLGGLTVTAAGWAAAFGLANGSSSMLLRVANAHPVQPSANTILFGAPALAVAWLLLLGVTLPRINLFLLGAALVLGANLLLQRLSLQQRRAPTGGTHGAADSAVAVAD